VPCSCGRAVGPTDAGGVCQPRRRASGRLPSPRCWLSKPPFKPPLPDLPSTPAARRPCDFHGAPLAWRACMLVRDAATACAAARSVEVRVPMQQPRCTVQPWTLPCVVRRLQGAPQGDAAGSAGSVRNAAPPEAVLLAQASLADPPPTFCSILWPARITASPEPLPFAAGIRPPEDSAAMRIMLAVPFPEGDSRGAGARKAHGLPMQLGFRTSLDWVRAHACCCAPSFFPVHPPYTLQSHTASSWRRAACMLLRRVLLPHVPHACRRTSGTSACWMTACGACGRSQRACMRATAACWATTLWGRGQWMCGRCRHAWAAAALRHACARGTRGRCGPGLPAEPTTSHSWTRRMAWTNPRRTSERPLRRPALRSAMVPSPCRSVACACRLHA
jgi:hypothetical protein